MQTREEDRKLSDRWCGFFYHFCNDLYGVLFRTLDECAVRCMNVFC